MFEKSVVSIITYNEDGHKLDQGNGFFVDNSGDVITYRCLLKSAYKVELLLVDKTYTAIKVIQEDKETDLIRLKTDIPVDQIQALPIATTTPQVGDKVCVISNAPSISRNVVDATIREFQADNVPRKLMKIDGHTTIDYQGSPVLNKNGEVIGMFFLLSVDEKSCNLVTPISRLDSMIESSGETIAEWWANFLVWSDLAEGIFLTGQRFLWLDELKKAVTYFELAVSKNHVYAQAHSAIGYCYIELNQDEEALPFLELAIRIKPDYVNAYNNIGFIYLKQHKLKEAIETFNKALSLDPKQIFLYTNLSIAYNEAGQYKEEIEVLHKAIAIKPNDLTLRYSLILAYAKQKQEQEALALLDQLEIDYSDFNTQLILGMIYNRLENYQKAIMHYEEAIKIKPDVAEAYRDITTFNIKIARYEEAIEMAKKAISIKPDYVDYFNLGLAHHKLKKYQEAIDYYKQAIKLAPTNSSIFYNLGNLYLELERLVEALYNFKEAIKHNPNIVEYHHNAGMALTKLKRNHEAIGAFSYAIKLNPSYVNSYVALGTANLNLGRFQDAIEAYKKAIELKPDIAAARFNMAQVYIKLNNRAGAIEQHEILKTLDKTLADKLGSSIPSYWRS